SGMMHDNSVGRISRSVRFRSTRRPNGVGNRVSKFSWSYLEVRPTKLLMNTDELKTTLDTLHEELTHGQQLADEARKRLQVLLADIQDVLAREPQQASDVDDEGLGERLQEAVSEFEAAHPRFSQLIGRIADGLSNLGI